MSRILAALDSSLATLPVIETALRFGRQLRAEVSAVHVADRDTELAASRAAVGAGVGLRVMTGAVPAALLRAQAAPEVLAAVVGAHTPAVHPLPFGHVVRHLMRRSEKPLIVVPPEIIGDARPIRRVLFVLDADESASDAGLALLDHLGSDVEILVGRVFADTPDPMFAYQRIGDRRLLSDDRVHPDALSVLSNHEFRHGRPSDCIVAVARVEQVDLVVLRNSRRFYGPHSVIVSDLAARSPVPVVLVGGGTAPRRSRITRVAL